MGRVLSVYDRDLHRRLAMKVVRTEGVTGPEEARLRRFVFEARITGQLQHPGIVPVHELGWDERGELFFTMQLVEGLDLSTVFAESWKGNPEWSLIRVLGVLERVCDTLAYAHARGVLHRDLKPGNVRVGNFGEVYVLDWGLARLLDGREVAEPWSIEEGEANVDLTRPGSVLGTPFYMAPEQARGGGDDITERTDVYAVGAMLYELLTREAPYEGMLEERTFAAFVASIGRTPPTRVPELAPRAPGELVAICEKAMAPEASKRYVHMHELASDLRAYLEGRVVRAHRTGPLAELSKWVRRNRVLSSTVLLFLVVLVVSTIWFVANLREERDRTAAQEERARTTLGRLFDLSVVEVVRDLRRRADDLWPADQDRIAGLEAWLVEAREVRAQRAAFEREIAALETREATDPAWSGTTAIQRRWHDRLLRQTLREIVVFVEGDEDENPRQGTSLPVVLDRLERARDLARRWKDPALHRLWEEARRQMFTLPAYGGWAPPEQRGLHPLGVDPDSGLMEFAVLDTGVVPTRTEEGRLEFTTESALVLVLLPGGTFRMGADPERDPDAEANEGPVHEVTLVPYFLSKFEMTQGQWWRLRGERPANHGARSLYVEDEEADLHPVESVSWFLASEVLARVGLALPTEAQWEFAARADRERPWPLAESREAIESSALANLADRTAFEALGDEGWACEHHFRDGWVMHAPVGRFPANPFGFHDVMGNVLEWVDDEYASYRDPTIDDRGARPRSENPRIAMYRGGSFDRRIGEARSANRGGAPPGTLSFSIGLRPARPLDPVPRER